MATFTYNVSTENADYPYSTIVFTTADTPSQYQFTGVGRDSSGIYSVDNTGKVYSGYQITGVSGTFDGKSITGLLPSNNDKSFPATNYSGGPGQVTAANPAGQYDNVLWISSSQGHDGFSYYGIDDLGVAIHAGDQDYRIFGGYPGGAKLQTPTHYQINNTGYYRETVFDSSTYPGKSTSAPCYTTGTRIRVLRAGAEVDAPVEELSVGDLAVTASGRHRPIRWIGRRTIDCRRQPDPASIWPIRIAAGALGENRPARDLRVSPGHSLALTVLDEVLIPAGALVNGATVVREEVGRVTYWHVELDSHDLLVAEGQSAESYLDVGNRAFFGGNPVVTLGAGPDDTPPRTHAEACRPHHPDGPIVDAVRLQLRRRAEALGWRVAAPATWDGVRLEIDGRVVRPTTRDLSACFVLPADAQEVWLVCPTIVPREIGDLPDGRSLGLCLSGLWLHDGLHDPRSIALDDPRLVHGFHDMAPDHRWTAGRARLPPDLRDGLDGPVLLRIDLYMEALPRLVAPPHTSARERRATA